MEEDFLKNHCKLVVDNRKLYEAWAEEYPYPTFGSINIIGAKYMDMLHDGIITNDQITDMGSILLGESAGSCICGMHQICVEEFYYRKYGKKCLKTLVFGHFFFWQLFY